MAKNVELTLKQLVVEHLLVEQDDIKDDSNFKDDLGADSLDEVELLMSVEEEFDIDLSDEQGESVSTFSEAVILIKSLI